VDRQMRRTPIKDNDRQCIQEEVTGKIGILHQVEATPQVIAVPGVQMGLHPECHPGVTLHPNGQATTATSLTAPKASLHGCARV